MTIYAGTKRLINRLKHSDKVHHLLQYQVDKQFVHTVCFRLSDLLTASSYFLPEHSVTGWLQVVLHLIVLFFVSFVCKCALYYCHWVST